MTLFEKLIIQYPELTIDDFGRFGSIELRDDSDGFDVYIAKWDYEKPLPKGFKLGK